MGYKVQAKNRIDLSDLGDNNGTPFFVEIRNPRLLTFNEKIQFAKIAKIEDDIERTKAMTEHVQGLIVSWNLIDQETEQTVNPKDENAFDRVPSEVVEKIMAEMKPKQDEQTKN